METSNNRNLNYSFIAVPTNLFFALDNNLRNALTVLLQLSSVFADQNGYFFRTNEDLQADLKMGKNLTIAVLESLYQYGLLQVKSVGFTKKNSKKQVNFYRVNVEKFKDYEQYHVYTITKNEELHLETVDYKAKGFKVTYTASTVEESILSPTDAQKSISEEIPTHDTENVTEPKETANNDAVEVETPTEEVTEPQIDLEFTSNSGVDEVEEIKKVVEEIAETPTTFEIEEDDAKELNNEELEERLIQYYNDNKDSITTEALYNDFETVYNMVLNNYKDNGQITFEQYNHARLFIVQPRLSALRYKISQVGQVETRSLQPSNVATLTTTKVEENNVTEEKKIASEENVEFINPFDTKAVEKDITTEEQENLFTKLIIRMNVLFRKCTNRNEVQEAYNKIVNGIEKTYNDGKISDNKYSQLKQKAWWLYTDNFKN